MNPAAVKAALALVMAFLVGLPGCGRPVEEESRDLAPLPELSMEGMDAPVRESLQALLASVGELRGTPDADPSELARRYGELGRYCYVHGLPKAARICFRNALVLAPGEFTATYYLGMLHVEGGRWEEAEESFKRALEIREDYVPAMLRLSEISFQRNDPEAALPFLEKALTREEYAPAAHYGLGRLEASRGAHDRAVGHFEAALKGQPAATRIHYSLGLAYRNLGKRKEAETHLRAHGPVEIAFPDPLVADLKDLASGAGSYLKAGGEAFMRGLYREAAREYRAAVDADAGHPEARKALALALERLGDLRGAMEQYRVLIDLLPSDAHTRHNLAVLLSRTGVEEEATVLLRRAVQLDPDFRDAHLSLARTLERRGMLQEALSSYRRVLELDPHDRRALLERPGVLRKLGRPKEAVVELRRVVEADPADGEARVNLGSALVGLGELDEALRVLEEALELEPGPMVRGRSHHNIGVIHSRKGEFQEAAVSYRSAVEQDPDLLDSRFHLATALAMSRSYEESAEEYAVVVEADPGHVKARLGQATSLVLLGRYAEVREILEAGLSAVPGQRDLSHTLAKLLAAAPDPDVRDGRRALDLALEVYGTSKGLEQAETVAMAYAEIGEFQKAVEWQQRLVAEAEKLGHPTFVRQLRENLARYERGERCLAPW